MGRFSRFSCPFDYLTVSCKNDIIAHDCESSYAINLNVIFDELIMFLQCQKKCKKIVEL